MKEIEKLKQIHAAVWLNTDDSMCVDEHAKASMEFSIGILERLIYDKRHLSAFDFTNDIVNLISEYSKQIIDENS